MKYENYTFAEAVKLLADRAGVKLPELEYTEEMKAKENHRARLLAVNKEAAKYYYYQLRSKKGEVGYRYLSERKLSEETMNKFGLGYASDGLVRYLREKGYEDKLIIEAGLAGFNEKEVFTTASGTGLCSLFRTSTTGLLDSAAGSWERENPNT